MKLSAGRISHAGAFGGAGGAGHVGEANLVCRDDQRTVNKGVTAISLAGLLLLLVSIPCLAQDNPKPIAENDEWEQYRVPRAGFVGHKDCRAYFLTDSEFYHVLPDPPLATLARMTDAEKEQWRRDSVTYRYANDLTPDEEKWWAKKGHEKFPGLCYLPYSCLKDPKGWGTALNGPLFNIRFVQTNSSHQETQTATDTTTSRVPVEGQATVIDDRGNVSTAAVSGTATVETTTSYPADVTIYTDNARASVWRATGEGDTPARPFITYKSRRRGDLGWVGTIELFRHAPRENAFHECLKFLMLETGLKKK